MQVTFGPKVLFILFDLTKNFMLQQPYLSPNYFPSYATFYAIFSEILCYCFMFVKATMLLVRKMKRIQGGTQQIIYKTPSKLSEVTLIDGNLLFLIATWHPSRRTWYK